MKSPRPFSVGKPRRQTRLCPTRLRVELLEDRSVPSVSVNEAEPPGTTGLNDTLATAQYLPGFGTGPGQYSAADISGVLKRLPRTISAAEDDGSILLGNATGLVAGGSDRVLVRARIGDGPHGSAGTGSGDYDHYRVSAHAGDRKSVV